MSRLSTLLAIAALLVLAGWKAEEELPWRPTKKDFRASRDIFFYQRGDTAYYLFDPTDTLQRLEDHVAVWRTRPMAGAEREYWEGCTREINNLTSSYNHVLLMDCAFFMRRDGKTVRRVDRHFVDSVKAITREEYAAFTEREHYRREEARKRRPAMAYMFYFGKGLKSCFDAEFLLVPDKDGTYTLQRINSPAE